MPAPNAMPRGCRDRVWINTARNRRARPGCLQITEDLGLLGLCRSPWLNSLFLIA
jgi:hypothetical protein